jgi:GTPase SAR1 family protein
MSVDSTVDKGAIRASREIDKYMNQSSAIESEKIKLLLLGAGESGKSTVFKQMRLLFGAPLTEEEKIQITPIVHANIISSMKLLTQATESMGYMDKVRLKTFKQRA